MKDTIIRIKSISQLCEQSGFGKPTHPLIHIVDVSKWAIGPEQIGIRYTSELYTIALKDKSCGIQYGRNSYDFDEGVMMFTAPNQVVSSTKEQKLNEIQGWMLFFHPDLIRHTTLGAEMDKYSFFSYDVHEALHLSKKEQQTITDIVDKIQEEVLERIDNHSNRVIVAGLELLLSYAWRYYERQFNTRKAANSDVVSQVETLLKEYYDAAGFLNSGMPSGVYFAEKVHLSSHYLSDLMKKETGLGLKDYINAFVVEKAKTLLLTSSDSVSGIAYTLGFNYPHYFSRLFRSKTGLTPSEYRELN
ncbi:MAG TPA: helix-turn-helix transcriptional regulator [Saprospiraceae bacterium]|nr:helix-turn-helix transcriptional regulator [Saprospiraceae bacterium]HMQ81555.1 helix-turn-helix transcriptional regulator [Saprospiraceae bacterium]